MVSVEELLLEIGDFPRSRKVVVCHGTFDIVHPGHIRHLQYAKSKAEILVTSVTSDEHIKKGNYRPYVPENLRAANLAEFEMVDFVIIDSEATPLENLRKIKPDFFAKGYEYQNGEINPKTQEEIEVINSYGGTMLFTPGDIVYSSSALIDIDEPELKYEKLLNLMSSQDISFSDLKRAINSLKGINVHIVGDTIIDRQTICTPYGGGTKTPTLSVRFEKQQDFVGGAAIVSKHLKSAGAEVTFTTLVGDDEIGRNSAEELRNLGIVVNVLSEANRPTTIKDAVIVQGYRLLKIDTVENAPILEPTLNQLSDIISSLKTDLVVFSDFRHGIFNKNTIETLKYSIPDGIFTAADSQVATRWGNILEFKGFDLITPNEKEARFSLGDQDTVIRPLAKKLYDTAKCKTLILKCGDKGIITYVKHDDDYRAFFSVDTFTRNLVDAVGAGDALLAYSSLLMASGNVPLISSIIGNIAAGLECELDGNQPITPEMILGRIEDVEKISKYEY